MDFGDWDDFGAEACADFAMAMLEDPMRSVLGRARVWIGGKPIGRMDEWGTVLPLVAQDLESIGRRGQRRWHPILESLDPVTRHRLVDRLLFGVEHGDEADAWEAMAADENADSRLADACIFTNTTESFDGWKVILLEEPGSGQLHWSWRGPDSETITTHISAVEAVTEVASRFASWVEEAQAEWTEMRG